MPSDTDLSYDCWQSDATTNGSSNATSYHIPSLLCCVVQSRDTVHVSVSSFSPHLQPEGEDKKRGGEEESKGGKERKGEGRDQQIGERGEEKGEEEREGRVLLTQLTK